ncbi:Uncharacterised protein [Vibrio cholerae]|nr:Uncharacterised protein [Vibrio cholerae]CSC66678.1 Uncharacterised protein [Vibrio cholerae]
MRRQLIEFPIFTQHRHTRHAAQLFFHCIEQRHFKRCYTRQKSVSVIGGWHKVFTQRFR